MKLRNPQRALPLDGAAEEAPTRWHDGAALAYLGASVTLRLGIGRRETTLEGDQLHLPLPPASTARQIRDAAEAWLRAQAVRLISSAVTAESHRLGRMAPPPLFALSFARHASGAWQERDGGLRFHWRLVEQPEDIIRQVVRRAVGALPTRVEATPDLFGFSPA